MSFSVYLVIHIDTRQNPPVITSAGIYSEPASTLTGAFSRKTASADVFKHQAESFAEARSQVLDMVFDVNAMGLFHWLRPLLERERSR